MIILVVFGLCALLFFYVIVSYNELIRSRNRYRNAFAQIDVQLKRRHDLVPNLVAMVKRYMAHERETLEAVIAARQGAEIARLAAAANPGDPGAMNALAQAEGGLGGMLGRLFALSEAYPDLKANQNMMQLSEKLSSTENRISFARQAFNDAVMNFNNYREAFPTNIVAGIFNFVVAESFEVVDPAEREAVKVQF